MAEVYKLPKEWFPVSIAPSDSNLEVCVMDRSGSHSLIFPVCKKGDGWVDASTKKLVDIVPTHWRKWADGQ